MIRRLRAVIKSIPFKSADQPTTAAQIRRARRFIVVWSVALLIYVVFLKWGGMVSFGQLQLHWLIHQCVMCVFTLIFLRLFIWGRLTKEHRQAKKSNELSARALDLANRMGVPKADVFVAEGEISNSEPYACIKCVGRIIVSNKTISIMTEAEIDCILAHELAHADSKRIAPIKRTKKNSCTNGTAISIYTFQYPMLSGKRQFCSVIYFLLYTGNCISFSLP